jgi:hypothetical protein
MEEQLKSSSSNPYSTEITRTDQFIDTDTFRIMVVQTLCKPNFSSLVFASMIKHDRAGRKPLLELIHPVGQSSERACNDEWSWSRGRLEAVRRD